MSRLKISCILTFILLHFLFVKVLGQTYDNCANHDKIFIRVEQPPQYNGSLQDYFENELKTNTGEYEGTVQISVIIDSSGSPCCIRIQNNNSFISSKKFKEVIDKMTGWTSAKQNNHVVVYNAFIQLEFKGSKFNVRYINDKFPPLMPVINTNTSNHPEISEDKQTGIIWKLWDFNNSMIPSNLSRSISMDIKGAIWYCTDGGVIRIANENWKIYSGMNVPELAGKNNRTWTIGLNTDKSGNVWIQSFDYIVKFDGKKWVRFDSTNSPLKLVNKIYVDKNGEVWFCTFKGLIKYNGQNWTTYSTSNSELVSDNVHGIYSDNKGTVWVATGKGIDKFTNGHWTHLNNTNSKIPYDDITCINGDSHGNIWAGAGARNNMSSLVKIDSAGYISLYQHGTIWNITIDERADKIWLATNGEGLLSFDGTNFAQYDKSNSIIPSNTVSDVLIDENGDKWLSTFGGLIFTNIK